MSVLKLDSSQIIDLYVNKNKDATSIGRELSVCVHTIQKVLRENGVKIRNRAEAMQLLIGKISEKNLPEIIELYQEGWTLEEIAKKFGTGLTTISRHLRKLNLTRKAEESKRLRGTTSWGSRNANWKGGRRRSDGYIYIQGEHPRACNGYIAEHILVWEQTHRKRVPLAWIIHHINGIRDDNRPSNLVAMPRKKHSKNYNYSLLNTCQKRIRELEIENRQLRHALEDNQSIFYINEN